MPEWKVQTNISQLVARKISHSVALFRSPSLRDVIMARTFLALHFQAITTAFGLRAYLFTDLVCNALQAVE